MSKAKLGFSRLRERIVCVRLCVCVCIYVCRQVKDRFARSEFHINFNAPEPLAQSTSIGNIASSTYLRDQ